MKINWWMISFIAIAVLWGFREGCGCRKGTGDVVGGPSPEPVYLPGVETIIIDTHYVPEPKRFTRSDYLKIDGKKNFILSGDDEDATNRQVDLNDHVHSFDCSKDTAFDRSKFFPDGATIYRDSLPVSHGYAIIQDTVSENRITGRGFRLNQALPTVERTIPEKKRNVVYLGISGTGGKQNYLYSVSGDISLKDKRDRMYSLSGHVTVDNRFLIGAGVRWPVRWRK